ncbi:MULTISPECIES: GNAT family N-acetyltransferase [Frigoribacterium]|uniref:GNAT family N-acetyltransferase n=2 Tax=Microbacteriaceae TaxID=85023 RepID=UPI000A3DABF6|nr:phosphinothricin acetyltransferase [Frigoribacterium endophyticum]
MSVTVRAMAPDDWPAIEQIYQEGIDTGNATFETRTPTWDAFDAGKLAAHRFVAVDDTAGAVLGWVAASATSARPAYAGVVEHSVYVTAAARGRGIGWELLSAFLDSVDASDIWTVQSSIFPENGASLALHDRAGFRRIGTRERIARSEAGPYAGVWRDTVLIERRSPTDPS